MFCFFFIFLLANENNGVGNIVLLATEQLDPSSPIRDISGNNDEDLTSLSWLHDKNLLKGMLTVFLLNLKKKFFF